MFGLSWNVWSAAVPLQSGPGRPLGHPSSDQTRLPAALGQMVLTQIEQNSFRLDSLGPDIAASDWTSKFRPDASPAALGGISSDMPPWTKQFPDRLSMDSSGKDIQAQTGQPQPQIGQPWTRHPSHWDKEVRSGAHTKRPRASKLHCFLYSCCWNLSEIASSWKVCCLNTT